MGFSRTGSNPVRSVLFLFQAEKECSELTFQLESLTERLDEAESFQSAQVR